MRSVAVFMTHDPNISFQEDDRVVLCEDEYYCGAHIGQRGTLMEKIRDGLFSVIWDNGCDTVVNDCIIMLESEYEEALKDAERRAKGE